MMGAAPEYPDAMRTGEHERSVILLAGCARERTAAGENGIFQQPLNRS